MKTKLFLLAFILSLAIITGCKNAVKNEAGNPNECTGYVCPMHADKTSVTPAKCSECNMEMEPVFKKNENDSVNTNQNGK